jgi:integrase
MDLALLTGLRRGDLLSITRSQLKDDGIHVRTSKTGRKLIIEWNDELRAVIAREKKRKPQVRRYLIATLGGKQYTGNGFQSIWQRAIKKAIENGTLEQRFTFNDLRSKSASDTADVVEASERLGHSSIDLTRRVYRRKPAKVRPLMRAANDGETTGEG